MTVESSVPPRCFTRFLDLVEEDWRYEWFTLSGEDCFFREWVCDHGRYRVILENRHGRRIDLDAERLAGNYFGVERL